MIATGCMASGIVPAAQGPTAALSPDLRPVLVLEPPQGPLMLMHHAAALADKRPDSLPLKLGHWIATPVKHPDHADHKGPLPALWLSGAPDRGFSQALLMQLSQAAANWPWRNLIPAGSDPDGENQLQNLNGQDGVLAVVREELADLGGKVEFHISMELTTVRGGGARPGRTHAHVEYFAGALKADTARPRRAVAQFAQDGPLDEQVGTAATDLSQFLATIVARISVPESLHPHNPTMGELGLHPVCGACRASDQVIYQQPKRVWVRAGRLSGTILSLPLPENTRPTSRTR